MSEPLIALNNVEVLYADVILSLKGITLEVASGGCTVLLGPNGAGKSTTLKTISGMLDVEEGRVASGNVRMLGQEVTGRSAEQMVAQGVVHVVEGRKVLRHMTVEQNLVVGGHRLKRMAECMAKIEQGAVVFRFALICRDDLSLGAHGMLNGLHKCVRFPREDLGRVRFTPGEEVRVVDQAVFRSIAMPPCSKKWA